MKKRARKYKNCALALSDADSNARENIHDYEASYKTYVTRNACLKTWANSAWEESSDTSFNYKTTIAWLQHKDSIKLKTLRHSNTLSHDTTYALIFLKHIKGAETLYQNTLKQIITNQIDLPEDLKEGSCLHTDLKLIESECVTASGTDKQLSRCESPEATSLNCSVISINPPSPVSSTASHSPSRNGLSIFTPAKKTNHSHTPQPRAVYLSETTLSIWSNEALSALRSAKKRFEQIANNTWQKHLKTISRRLRWYCQHVITATDTTLPTPPHFPKGRMWKIKPYDFDNIKHYNLTLATLASQLKTLPADSSKGNLNELAHQLEHFAYIPAVWPPQFTEKQEACLQAFILALKKQELTTYQVGTGNLFNTSSPAEDVDLLVTPTLETMHITDVRKLLEKAIDKFPMLTLKEKPFTPDEQTQCFVIVFNKHKFDLILKADGCRKALRANSQKRLLNVACVIRNTSNNQSTLPSEALSAIYQKKLTLLTPPTTPNQEAFLLKQVFRHPWEMTESLKETLVYKLITSPEKTEVSEQHCQALQIFFRKYFTASANRFVFFHTCLYQTNLFQRYGITGYRPSIFQPHLALLNKSNFQQTSSITALLLNTPHSLACQVVASY